MLKTVKIASYEIGLCFRNGEFKGLLGRGRHWFFDPLLKTRVSIVSQRDPWLVHDKLDVIVKSGALKDRAVVIGHQGRFSVPGNGSRPSFVLRLFGSARG